MKHLVRLAISSILVFVPIKTINAAESPVEERPKVQQGELPTPVITIRQTEKATIKEYRINGVLRAIKYTPTNGMPPYYLYDREGSGEFVRVGPDTGKQLEIPKWIFFTW